MVSQTTAIFTADYRKIFEKETASLLRKHFGWFVGIVGGISLLSAIAGIVFLAVRGGDVGAGVGVSIASLWIGQVLSLLVGLVFVAAFLIDIKARIEDRTILRATYWLVILQGSVNIVISYLFPSEPQALLPTRALIAVVLTHSIASVFLPWTVRQCLRPVVWLVLLNAGFLLVVSDHPPEHRVLVLLFSPLAGLPGAGICWLRQIRRSERSKFRFLKSRYGEVRRELVDARRIHEALFPSPIVDGPVRMNFAYEPMRQIGGDFVFCARGPEGVLTVVLADVTGHGIPAALTVNRLHGELERLVAEEPGISPGGLLIGLNRYTHLMLAPQSVYLTAICVRINPGDHSLEYASAGHPPAFIRTVDGRVEELGSTTIVLGATSSEDFRPDAEVRKFSVGDALVMYTDGAIECWDEREKMFGIDRMRAMVAGEPARGGHWGEYVLQSIEAYREGAPKDDTLVVEVYRPLY